MESHIFDPESPDDRLAHLVSMMFDSFALTADYGGIVQCPYSPEADEAIDKEGDENEDDVSTVSSTSSHQPATSDDDTSIEIATLPKGASFEENKSKNRLIRTAIGLVYVDMQLAGRPTALSDIPNDGPQVIFSHGPIEIRKSALGGFGVFATKDLAYREHILFERALFHAKGPSAITAFEALNATDKNLFLDLHGHDVEDDSLEALIRAIFFTNNFVCGNRAGGGVFLAAARFNHACSARCSVKYAYDITEDVMTFTIGRHGGVKAGEELTLCYGKDRDMLKKQYGFDCQCGACDSILRDHNEQQITKWSV